MLTQSFLLCALAASAFAASSSASSSSAASSSAASASASSSSDASSSIDLLVGTGGTSAQYEANIVNVDDCSTTIGIVCTAGQIELASYTLPCNGDVTATVTTAPGTYIGATTTSIAGISASISNACQISGTTRAVCSVTVKASTDGTAIETSTTFTLSGTEAAFSAIPVTAGANKLQSTCTASGNTNAAAPTGIVDVVKVLVPAAALVAGAVL